MNWKSNQTFGDDSVEMRSPLFSKQVIIAFVLFFLAVPLTCRWIGDLQYGHQAPPAASIISMPTVQAKLMPGEKILWSSNVDVDKREDESMVGAYFGLPFTFVGAFAIGVGLLGAGRRVSWLRLLFFVPFLAAGLFLNTGPYWMHKQSLETVCMLTDIRALEVQSGRAVCNEKYSKNDMTTPEYVEYAHDRGNVLFYYAHKRRGKQGFRGIADGASALAILNDKIKESDK